MIPLTVARASTVSVPGPTIQHARAELGNTTVPMAVRLCCLRVLGGIATDSRHCIVEYQWTILVLNCP